MTISAAWNEKDRKIVVLAIARRMQATANQIRLSHQDELRAGSETIEQVLTATSESLEARRREVLRGIDERTLASLAVELDWKVS